MARKEKKNIYIFRNCITTNISQHKLIIINISKGNDIAEDLLTHPKELVYRHI